MSDYASPPRGGYRRRNNSTIRARREMVTTMYADAAERIGGHLTWLDDEKWIGRYSTCWKGGALIHGYDLGLNRDTFSKVCGSKKDTAEILFNGVIFPVERNRVAPFHSGFIDDLNAMEYRIGKDACFPIVLAPDSEEGGSNVHLIRSSRELTEAVTSISDAGHLTMVWSPFIEFTEFRVIVLDGVPQLVYEKVRTGSEWRHNLGSGARARTVDLGSDEAIKLVELAVNTLRCLGGTFASVDIAVPTSGSAPQVLEVNAEVVMGNYAALSPANRDRAVDIYAGAFSHRLHRT